MAKRRSDNSRLVMDIILILLAVVTLLTLFIPMLKYNGSSVVGSSTTNMVGTDNIGSIFAANGRDLTAGGNILYNLLQGDDSAFVAGAYGWCYFITMIAAAGCLVFSLLDMLHIRLGLFNKICALALGLGSLVTMIFGFIVPGKMASLSLGSLANISGSVAFGLFLLLAGLVYAGLYLFQDRK